RAINAAVAARQVGLLHAAYERTGSASHRGCEADPVACCGDGVTCRAWPVNRHAADTSGACRSEPSGQLVRILSRAATPAGLAALRGPPKLNAMMTISFVPIRRNGRILNLRTVVKNAGLFCGLSNRTF